MQVYTPALKAELLEKIKATNDFSIETYTKDIEKRFHATVKPRADLNDLLNPTASCVDRLASVSTIDSILKFNNKMRECLEGSGDISGVKFR